MHYHRHCSRHHRCTVRGGSSLKYSPSRETTYVPAASCYQAGNNNYGGRRRHSSGCVDVTYTIRSKDSTYTRDCKGWSTHGGCGNAFIKSKCCASCNNSNAHRRRGSNNPQEISSKKAAQEKVKKANQKKLKALKESNQKHKKKVQERRNKPPPPAPTPAFVTTCPGALCAAGTEMKQGECASSTTGHQISTALDGVTDSRRFQYAACFVKSPPGCFMSTSGQFFFNYCKGYDTDPRAWTICKEKNTGYVTLAGGKKGCRDLLGEERRKKWKAECEWEAKRQASRHPFSCSCSGNKWSYSCKQITSRGCSGPFSDVERTQGDSCVKQCFDQVKKQKTRIAC